MFRTFVVAVLGWIVGAILTYLVVVLGTVIFWDLMGVHDQDGGGAMALGLVIGPTVAVFGGIVAAVLLARWYSKRKANSPPPTDVDQRRDRNRFGILGGAIGGAVVGYYLAQFGFWLASPLQFDSYWKAWVVSWVPTLLILLSAVWGGLLVRWLVRL